VRRGNGPKRESAETGTDRGLPGPAPSTSAKKTQEIEKIFLMLCRHLPLRGRGPRSWPAGMVNGIKKTVKNMKRLSGRDIVLKVLGLLLLVAAVLKGHELLTVPVANTDLWSWRPFLIFQGSSN
jgi:hypothetical protein